MMNSPDTETTNYFLMCRKAFCCWQSDIWLVFGEMACCSGHVFLCTAAPLLCSVFLLIINELLRLLGQPPPLSLLLLQGLLCFLTLVDLHPGERQTQQQCLQAQDVQEDGDIVQSLIWCLCGGRPWDKTSLCYLFHVLTQVFLHEEVYLNWCEVWPLTAHQLELLHIDTARSWSVMSVISFSAV